MDSLKVEEEGTGSRAVEDAAVACTTFPPNGRSEMELTQTNKEVKKKRNKKWKRKYSYLPRIGCLRIEEDEEGNFDAEVENVGEPANPVHLVVMVNGLMGSAQNWKFAAKRFLIHYPRDIIVHCSKANSLTLTFDGVDVMGERLAEEVISVIERHPSVKKISFIGHSLGGLVARYAIAKLYGRYPAKAHSQGNGDCKGEVYGDRDMEQDKSRIAGLEPMNFITFATPHLGSRGHKQVPMFCGFHTLEKAASHISWFLGKTGKHLFLTDGDNGKPPLLLQMVSDCEDLKFMSALQSFKRHVAYANIRFDSLVGWSTSSLRHQNELPKKKNLSRDEKYRHIVHMETAKSSSPQQELPLDAKVDEHKSIDMEEQMIQALTKLNWERVDVKFNGYKQRFLAHNTILVARYCLYSSGADVVQHMIDNFLL
ncbi:putative lipase ROG1 [Jatropha curcas]|uniref:putative lipase ROG1 n=1 Tax=Jatropha curcas TaxID=180498 RepID=UPI0005FBA3A0|nr:putative lipase ROG1 [Jatropha curcas]XP_037493704.1 putative lipase ROG1 [Jatropha curcas]